jgi:peptidoglycan/xylan/chitin deacetylase (PgdA/CDA1 family)
MRAIALLFHDVYAASAAESGFVSEAAHRYKLAVSDFDAQLAGVSGMRRDTPIVAASILNGGSASPAPVSAPMRPALMTPFLMTFDDGGESYYTKIADRLERRGWFGHCFVSTNFIGRRAFLDRTQIRSLADRGHVIGSHSASHPTRFSALSYGDMVSEWSRSRQVLEDILARTVDVASVPGGYFSPAVARAAHEAGIRVLFTSEPVTQVQFHDGCAIVGRFTIRRGDRHDAAQRLVAPAPWARSLAWVSWNAKGLIKPILGPSYIRLSDWLLTPRTSSRA